MISKAVSCKPLNDNYQALASYVGAANHEAEKLLHRWHVGCAFDDYSTAIKEVCATQDKNTRTTREKTYHLLISIAPEDDVKLSLKDWQDIEALFAEVLGYSDHQRHCGIHNNTANTHMHVAYNMIHPQTFNRHEPFRDYAKRNQLCRELEKRYGLRIDVQENTHEPVTGPARKNDKAATVEAHTGQQSFDSYVQERKAQIAEGLEQAQNWQEVHCCLASMGIEIQITANGCTLKDRHGKHRVKASSLGRAYSKQALEKRLGSFEASSNKYPESERYTRKPLQTNAQHDALYKQYTVAMKARKSALDAISEEYQANMQSLRASTEERLQHIQRSCLLIPKHKISCRATALLQQKEQQEHIKKNAAEKRQAIREQSPFTSWAEFLQYQAQQGNEHALAILRTRKGESIPTATVAAAGNTENASEQDKDTPPKPHIDWNKKILEIYANTTLLPQDKRYVVAVTKMRQITEGDPLAAAFTHKIDHKGTVLFRFPNGDMIRDSGKEITFQAQSEEAKKIALAYAAVRFGKNVTISGNRIFSGATQSRGLFSALFGGLC